MPKLKTQAPHLLTGRRGEAIAAHQLLLKGYSILARNWRSGRAEIDIIAMDGATMVFAEVKTRSSGHYGAPEAFVDPKKMGLLADAAAAYMRESGHDWAVRFDVVGVILEEDGSYRIEHIEDAFFPPVK